MRFKDFLLTIIISTITSLIIIWTLINAGIIQTQQQYPQLYLKQQHSGTLIGVLNETSKKYEAYVNKLLIENVSNKATVRFLHISLEANVTNYENEEIVEIEYLRLEDQTLQILISEKNFRFLSTSYAILGIDMNANPIHSYYVSLKAKGTYNFTLTYNLTIVQEVLT